MSTRTQYKHQDSFTGLPDLLTIGPITNDYLLQDADRTSPGGTATYAAALTTKLNYKPSIVTSMKLEDVPKNVIPGTPVHVVSSPETTTFENSYNSKGLRKQRLIKTATRIKASDIPKNWIESPVILIGPVANEIDYSCARIFPNSIVVATIQGWLRQWDNEDITYPKEWDGTEVLPFLTAAIVSEDDFDSVENFQNWKTLANILIVTRGENGSTVFHSDKKINIPAWRVDSVDPTGAGDVYAAAFSLIYWISSDIEYAARFASCAASFSVQGMGIESIPSLKQIETRMTQHPNGIQ